MKKLNISLIVLLVLSSMFSCIDSEYHWDNLNKKGVVDLPPVPLGAFKAITIKDLHPEQIEIPALPAGEYDLKYSFNNLFGSSSIKRFFHGYVERDILLQGKLELFMLGKDSGIEFDIDFEPLNEENQVIKEVKIEGLKSIRYGARDLTIKIPQDQIHYMNEKNAKHLQMRLKFKFITPSTIELTRADSIKLSNMMIKTAGYLVDL